MEASSVAYSIIDDALIDPHSRVTEAQNFSKLSEEEQKLRQDTIQKYLLDYKYQHEVEQLDNHRSNRNDRIVQYFSIVGLEDPDIVHTLLSVKEMIHAGYTLNKCHDSEPNNDGILTGNRPYIKGVNGKVESTPKPQFHVPIFQPKVLTRVPQYDRARLMFPVNMPDFLYTNGIQVISIREVKRRLATNEQRCPADRREEKGPPPSFNAYPYIQSSGLFSNSAPNEIMTEIALTNQEAKIYYVTSYNYFIDLEMLDTEFSQLGLYNIKPCYGLEEQKQNQQYRQDVILTKIPKQRYFLPFSMSLISVKSYKEQFCRILSNLHRQYTKGQMKIGLNDESQEEQKLNNEESDLYTFEECVNQVVFGIPTPNKPRIEYFHGYLETLGKYAAQHREEAFDDTVVEVELPDGKIYFESFNPFDLQNNSFENIWTLIKTVSQENILQLFKRLLFSTSNILVGPEAKALASSILGIIELFYPLTCDIVVIPNCPQSMLQYVSNCGQSIIGVVCKKPADKKNKKKANTCQPVEEPQNDITLQDNIDLFDIMLDNQSKLDLIKHKSIQKPKQVVGFNVKGKLAQGQSVAKVIGGNKNQLLQNNQQQSQQSIKKQIGLFENLNDVELPKEHSKKIKEIIIKAYDRQKTIQTGLEKAMKELRDLQDSGIQSSRELELIDQIYRYQQQIQKLVLEVKLEFFCMIRTILLNFTHPEMLKGFKGSKRDSRHMTNFKDWIDRREIQVLIDKKRLKKKKKQANEANNSSNTHKFQFYQRLIYYPVLQNFLLDKYFPQQAEANIRQLHAIKEDERLMIVDYIKSKMKEADPKSVKKSVDKLQSEANMKCVHKARMRKFLNCKFKCVLFVKDKAKNNSEEGPVDPNYPFTLRILNEANIRSDFLCNYAIKEPKKDEKRTTEDHSECYDEKLQIILSVPANGKPEAPKSLKLSPSLSTKEQSEAEQRLNLAITNVVQMKYRMTIYYEKQDAKMNILISWLLLFAGSLDYQLTPDLFTETSQGQKEKQFNYYHYKNAMYYQAQQDLEKLLATYLDQVLKEIIYYKNTQYEFNEKCPLLNILLNYSQKYGYLHQKILEIIHQDIDAQQAGLNNTGNMNVTNFFMHYHLHWNNKQTYLTCPESKELADYVKFQVLKEKAKGMLQNHLMNYEESKNQKQIIAMKQKLEDVRKCQRLKKLQEAAGFNDCEQFIKKVGIWCPVSNNDYLTPEWTACNFRKYYLAEILANEELTENQEERRNMDILKKADEAKHRLEEEKRNNNKKKTGIFSQIKNGLSGLFMKNKHRDHKVDYYNFSSTSQSVYECSTLTNFEQKLKSWQTSQYPNQEQLQKQKNLLLNRQTQFRNQSELPRTFFSLNQIKNAVKVEDRQVNESEIDVKNLNMHLELEMVPNPNVNKDEVGKAQEALNELLKCCSNSKKLDNNLRPLLNVYMVSQVGKYKINTVKAMQPKAVRSGVETVLKICKHYKTLFQIDLSQFSQVEQEQELYWNLVFWFSFRNLPYMWMAPFMMHLSVPELPVQQMPIVVNKNLEENMSESMQNDVEEIKVSIDGEMNVDEQETKRKKPELLNSLSPVDPNLKLFFDYFELIQTQPGLLKQQPRMQNITNKNPQDIQGKSFSVTQNIQDVRLQREAQKKKRIELRQSRAAQRNTYNNVKGNEQAARMDIDQNDNRQTLAHSSVAIDETLKNPQSVSFDQFTFSNSFVRIKEDSMKNTSFIGSSKDEEVKIRSDNKDDSF